MAFSSRRRHFYSKTSLYDSFHHKWLICRNWNLCRDLRIIRKSPIFFPLCTFLFRFGSVWLNVLFDVNWIWFSFCTTSTMDGRLSEILVWHPYSKFFWNFYIYRKQFSDSAFVNWKILGSLQGKETRIKENTLLHWFY